MAVPARVHSGSVHLGVQSLTIEHAIDHLVGAAQGVVANQLELAKLDVELTASRLIRGAAIIGVGVFLVALGAVALAVAAYAAFPAPWPPEQRLAIIAATCAVLGIGLAAVGARRVRRHGGD